MEQNPTRHHTTLPQPLGQHLPKPIFQINNFLVVCWSAMIPTVFPELHWSSSWEASPCCHRGHRASRILVNKNPQRFKHLFFLFDLNRVSCILMTPFKYTYSLNIELYIFGVRNSLKEWSPTFSSCSPKKPALPKFPGSWLLIPLFCIMRQTQEHFPYHRRKNVFSAPCPNPSGSEGSGPKD